MAEPLNERYVRLSIGRWAFEVTAFAVAAWVVAQTAVVAKQSRLSPPMVAIDSVALASPSPAPASSPALPALAAAPIVEAPALSSIAAKPEAPVKAPQIIAEPIAAEPEIDPDVYTPPEGFVRYYDGRPLKAVRTIWMTVTAYSPDERSCGEWADGFTATNTSVWTNGMSLVAADTRILPFGSLLTVPGYSNGEVVPVLDRGGAIKGHRLDVLYPTHEIALKWGVRRIPVTVWAYADGKGAGPVRDR